MSKRILVLRALAVLATLGIFAVAFVGVRGFLAVRHLQKADHIVSALQDELGSSLSSGVIAKGAFSVAADASGDTRAAASLTGDPVWRAVAHLPFVGKYFDSLRRVSKAADLIVSEAVQPALQAASLVIPVRAQIHDATVPTEPFTKALPFLETAADAALRAQAAVDGARSTGIKSIDSTLQRFRSQLDRLAPRVEDARRTAILVPSMLGGSGIHRYFVGFLSNAESRTQGGFLGSFGILSATNGKLRFERFGSDIELKDAPSSVINFGPEFSSVYSGTAVTKSWRDSPQIGDFSEVAQVWMKLWKAQTGETLDGAFATDPVALSYALKVTGPAMLPDGEAVSGDDVVANTENIAYARFTDNAKRREYLKNVAEAASTKFITTRSPSTALFSALGRAIEEGRLKIWSAKPSDEEAILGRPIDGALPQPGLPLAYVAVNNALGNKMDYYLHRTLTYTPAACGRGAVIDIAFSTIPSAAGLPVYIAGSAKKLVQNLPFGTTVLATAIYVNGGQTFQSASIDGRPSTLAQNSERGLTQLFTNVTVSPGKVVHLTIKLAPPPHPGRVRIRTQPLVLPQLLVFKPSPTC